MPAKPVFATMCANSEENCVMIGMGCMAVIMGIVCDWDMNKILLRRGFTAINNLFKYDLSKISIILV